MSCLGAFHSAAGRGASFLAKYRPQALQSGWPASLSLRQNGVELVPQLQQTLASPAAFFPLPLARKPSDLRFFAGRAAAAAAACCCCWA